MWKFAVLTVWCVRGSRGWDSERPVERWAVRDKENVKNFLLMDVFSPWKSRSSRVVSKCRLRFLCYSNKSNTFSFRFPGRFPKLSSDIFSCSESERLPQTSGGTGSERSSADSRRILLSHWLRRFLPWHSVSSLRLQFCDMIEWIPVCACVCECVSCVACDANAGWAMLKAAAGVWAGGEQWRVSEITPGTWGREAECLFGQIRGIRVCRPIHGTLHPHWGLSLLRCQTLIKCVSVSKTAELVLY